MRFKGGCWDSGKMRRRGVGKVLKMGNNNPGRKGRSRRGMGFDLVAIEVFVNGIIESEMRVELWSFYIDQYIGRKFLSDFLLFLARLDCFSQNGLS